MKFYLCFVFIILTLACQQKKARLIFYIENISPKDSLVEINVAVNKKMLLNEKFKYSNIAPNYDTFIYDHPINDNLTIKAISNTGAINTFNLKFEMDTYIFLDYTNDFPLTKEEQISNERMKKELHGFDPIIFSNKKAIMKMVQYTKPNLH